MDLFMKIGNYLRIPRIIKVWLFWLFIAFGILVALFIGNIILGVYLFGNYRDYSQDQTLANIVNSVLEIPYFKKDFVIDRPEYIKTFTPEEWMNVKCKIRDVHKSDLAPAAKNYEHLSKEEKWHLNCIRPRAASKYRTDKSVEGELCSNQFNCQIRIIAVNHYVLEHPEILWSMIKIAERPCDFIKTFDRTIKKGEKYQYGDTEWDAILDAKSVRLHLCDKPPFFMRWKKPRKFVLISITDIENKRIMDIIVRRKDID